MQTSKQKVQNQEKVSAYVTFLNETREGKFANIENGALRYSRHGNDAFDSLEDCDEHFFSVS